MIIFNYINYYCGTILWQSLTTLIRFKVETKPTVFSRPLCSDQEAVLRLFCTEIFWSKTTALKKNTSNILQIPSVLWYTIDRRNINGFKRIIFYFSYIKEENYLDECRIFASNIFSNAYSNVRVFH